MGKSTLAIGIAQHIAVNGDPVAIFTLEMSREEIVSRMLCSQGRIDSQRLRTGRLTEGDFSKLSNAANVLYKKPIFVDDSAGLTVTEIRAKCRRLKRRQGLGLVVVDYLQLMHGTAGENRQQEIAIISRSLKSLARELDAPVVALSQLSRGVEAREGHVPRMSDLRESGSLEQDADVVILLYREEYYNPGSRPGEADLIVAKQRNGPTGVVRVNFMRHHLRFEDLAQHEPPPF